MKTTRISEPKAVLDVKPVKATIREIDDGWFLVWEDGKTVLCSTAGDALQAVRTFGSLNAQLGVSTAVVVTWEPSTSIGRAVVRALTSRN